MRKARHITVSVSPELYLQTRKLAAEMDSTVTAMVAYLLQRMPAALKAAGYKVTVPPAAATRPTPSPRKAAASSGNPPSSSPVPPCPEKIANSGCEAVEPNLTANFSKTSEGSLHRYTAPVPQYASDKSHILKDLQVKPEMAYSRFTAV